MSSIIPGLLIITSFLIISVMMFSTFLNVSTSQSEALRELGQISKERSASVINITSASVTSSAPGTGTDMTL
jgi:hypothetical protein